MFGVVLTDTVLATLGVVTTLDVLTADFGVSAICLVITVSVVMGNPVEVLNVGVVWYVVICKQLVLKAHLGALAIM